MRPKNDRNSQVARLALLSLAFCATGTVTIEAFAPGHLPYLTERNNPLSMPNALLRSSIDYKPRLLFKSLPAANRRVRTAPKESLVENEANTVTWSEPDVASQPKSTPKSLPEMELAFDSFANSNTLPVQPDLEAQQEDIAPTIEQLKIAESRQRALLQSRLTIDAKVRAKAAEEAKAQAKARALVLAELRQRSLFEAKLKFDAAAREMEALVSVDVDVDVGIEAVEDAEEMEINGSIEIEEEEEEYDAGLSETSVASEEEKEPTKLMSIETEKIPSLIAIEPVVDEIPPISGNTEEEVILLEKAAESRQRALLETRLRMEAESRAKAVPDVDEADAESMIEAELEHNEKEEIFLDPSELSFLNSGEGENEEEIVSWEEANSRADIFDSTFSQKTTDAAMEIKVGAVSFDEEEHDNPTKIDAASAEGEVAEIVNKSAKASSAWLKPKDSLTKLMKKDEKDIFSCSAGHFVQCVIGSGTAAVLAANSVVELVTNPEVVQTAKKGLSSISKEGEGLAKMKETFAFLSATTETIWKCAETSKTCKDTVAAAADVTNDFISGCVAMAAFGLKTGDNILAGYVAAKKAEEEARLKAEREAEEARRAEEERKRLEAERIETERRALEKIKMKAEKERRKVREQQIEAETRALKKIRREAENKEEQIEKDYQNAIEMVKEDLDSILAEMEADDIQQDVQNTLELDYFFAKRS